MSTGSAPISSEVFEFLRVCFGATVSEGYGMTETACTIAMTRPDDATIGHVGAPVDCCEIKLEDIPDMNYKNTDQPYPRGEVIAKGCAFAALLQLLWCMVQGCRMLLLVCIDGERCQGVRSLLGWADRLTDSIP